MPILDIQKRARELGRIRTGDKGGRGQPQKLTKFRLTSASKPLLERVAALYGGTVNSWDGAGTPQFEVYTDTNRIPILVPPQPVSQWLETWTGGGCAHRCDGVTNALTGDPCDPDDPQHQQAKPTTRLNVVLRDVEGVGVWRLESHGWNAAVELPNAAEFLAQGGGYIEGHLALEERVSKAVVNGKPQTRRFLVPTIEIDVTPAELLAGGGRIQPPAVSGPVQANVALEAGTTADPYTELGELVDAATTLDELSNIWAEAVQDGVVGKKATSSPQLDAFVAVFKAKADAVKAHDQATPDDEVDPDNDQVIDPEVVDEEVQAVWQKCLAAGGAAGIGLYDLEDLFASKNDGLSSVDASMDQMVAFHDHLKTLGGKS